MFLCLLSFTSFVYSIVGEIKILIVFLSETINLATDESAEREMRKYIKASLPVIEYIDKLYISKNISLDW